MGEKLTVTVVLPGEVPHISHSHTYFQDSVTERLFVFHFNGLEDLQIFLKRYLYFVSCFPIIILYNLYINLLILLIREYIVYGGIWCWGFAVFVQCSANENHDEVYIDNQRLNIYTYSLCLPPGLGL